MASSEDFDKAVDKITAALGMPVGLGMIHLSSNTLRTLNPHCTDADYTFLWTHQVMNPWSNIPALHDEICRQLENLFGPSWNEDSGVAHSMMGIVYTGIGYLIMEARAWKAYLMSRLKTRTTTSRADDDDDDDDVCSICLDVLCQRDGIIDVAVLDCRHEYHVQCIKKWLMHSNQNSCPLCKGRALEIDPREFLEVIDSKDIDEWIDGDMGSLLQNSVYRQSL